MRKSRLLLLPLLLAAAVHAGASVVIPIDVATQVDRADLIFIGTVLESESVPVRDGTFAYTYVTFHVEETLKGAADSPALTLRIAGGKARGIVTEIVGVPKFSVGGRHLLFVENNDRSPIPITGGSQGKLDLVRDPVTQEEVLADDAGRVIDGLRDLNWVRGGLRVDQGNRVQRPERVAEVISQEGVTVTLDQPDPDARPVPAAQVLSELRALIQSRAFGPEFKRTPAVQSASPSNVPATDPDRVKVRPAAQ